MGFLWPPEFGSSKFHMLYFLFRYFLKPEVRSHVCFHHPEYNDVSCCLTNTEHEKNQAGHALILTGMMNLVGERSGD